MAIPRPAESPLGPPMRSRQPRQARRWLSSQHLLLCRKEIPGMFGTDAGPAEPWGLFEDNRGRALGCNFPVGADSVVLAWGRREGWVAWLLSVLGPETHAHAVGHCRNPVTCLGRAWQRATLLQEGTGTLAQLCQSFSLTHIIVHSFRDQHSLVSLH